MESKKKDCWDKFAVVSPFLIFTIGAILTYCISQKYQQRQQEKDNNYKQIDLLVKLAPYLSSKDPLQNRVAIYSIRALGYDSLAVEIGASINTIGAREALKTISSDSSIPIKSRKIYIDKWDQLKKIPPTISVKDTVQYLGDENGNLILTAEGNPIIVEGTPLRNENGKPLLNENGKPLLGK